MKACRTASIFAFGALGATLAIGACQENAHVDVPPVTTAKPSALPTEPTAGGANASGSGEDAGAPIAIAKEPPAKVTFVDVPSAIDADACTHVLLAIARGTVKAAGETLNAGDVLAIAHPDALKLEGAAGGLAVLAVEKMEDCAVLSKPAAIKKLIRAKEAPELKFASGAMAARLDVGAKVSPTLYLGRLEGTAGVPEHTHPGSWEFLAAIDAKGTFVLDGTEGKLGPKQVVTVPPGAKHAWKPDPGSRLVAVQLYSPPGPEQRFVGLAAADKDAGTAPAAVAADAGAKK